jgi:alkanesulfonate monooxygenase SsuD/methylene tetrahydromethanopterin reductase-like flavin-dependent oxidoreductase (luciferase family)
MRIGIGLPSTTLDVDGRLLLDWARRAEARGFSSLATIDRVAYPSYDSLTALAVAGAVTERIGLLTNILLAPAYNPVLLAKQTASIDQIAGGRLTLGLGVGSRPDDYQLTGQSFEDRGGRFDALLDLLRRVWAGEPVEGSSFPVSPPAPRGTIPLLIGGRPELAAPRAARVGAGYTIGGAPPEQAAGAVKSFLHAYEQAGGEGRPPLVALAYFSLGDDHEAESLHNLRTYYGSLGDWAEAIATAAARTPDDIRTRVAAFEAAGFDELILDPTVADLDQVDLLADTLGDSLAN